MTKEQNEKHHARVRAFERYGLVLTKTVHKEFVDTIRKECATLVSAKSNRVKIYDVFYRDRCYRVIYDSKRGVLVSFLEPNALCEIQVLAESHLTLADVDLEH